VAVFDLPLSIIPEHARGPWVALTRALVVSGPPPCETGNRDDWWQRGCTERTAVAVAACQTCPVQWECGAYALAADEPHGVWGGLTGAERRRLTSPAVSKPRPRTFRLGGWPRTR
jgi:transcription factor WhiB